MIKLPEDVLEKLDNEVDLSQLLYAVDDFAELRESASDGRNELLQLYELLRRLIQEERTPGKRDGEKIFELADSIECTLSSVVEMAKKISEIISSIQTLVLEGEDESLEGDDDADEED